MKTILCRETRGWRKRGIPSAWKGRLIRRRTWCGLRPAPRLRSLVTVAQVKGAPVSKCSREFPVGEEWRVVDGLGDAKDENNM